MRAPSRGLALFAAALLMAGCTSSSEPDETAQSSGSPNASAQPSGASASASGSAKPSATASKSTRSTASPSSSLVPAETSSRPRLPKVKPTQTATTSSGVSVTIPTWESVKIPAGAPGEIGGPGVALTVRVVNDSTHDLDLSNVLVDLRYGSKDTPALRADRAPTVPFDGSVKAGDAATAVYAFRIDADDRDQVQVLVGLNPEQPVVVFEGSLK